MHCTKVRLPAAAFLLALFFASSQPACHADWRDTLIRAVAPRLVDRSLDYFMRTGSRSSARQTPTAVPSRPKATNSYQPPTERGDYHPAQSYSSPVAKSNPLANQSATTAGKRAAGRLEVPPPPNTLVPPPPAGVPTGAILGLYPPELYKDALQTSLPTKPVRKGAPPPPQLVASAKKKTEQDAEETASTAEPQEEAMPKPAPDFRRRKRP